MTLFLAPPAGTAPGVPGYVSGGYYGAKASGTYPGFSANTLYLWPVRIDQIVTVDRVAWYSSAAVVGNVKFGIYDASAAGGRPGNLIRENTADISTNAVALLPGSFASNPTLVPAWYWLACCFSAAAQGSAATGAGTAAVSWLQEVCGDTALLPPAGNPQVKRTAALTYTAGSSFFPATCGAISVADAAPPTPVLQWRAA